MTSNRLKSLAKLRLILSVIAILLAALMVVSGVMHFRVNQLPPPVGEPTESVSETVSTTAPETTETEVPTTENTTVSTEASETTETAVDSTEATFEEESPQAVQVGISNGAPGSGHSPSHPSSGGGAPSGDNNSDSSEDEDNPGDNNTSSGTENRDPSDIGTDTESSGSSSSGTDTGSGNPSDTDSSGSSDTGSNTESSGSSGSGNGTESSGSSGSGNATESSGSSGSGNGTESNGSSGSGSGSSIVDTPDPSENNLLSAFAAAEKLANTEADTDTAQEEPARSSMWGIVFWISAALLAADLIAILLISRQIEQELKKDSRRSQSLARTDAHARSPRPASPEKSKSRSSARPDSVPAATGTAVQRTEAISNVATIHQIGQRDYQQDSLGHTAVLDDKGILAVVADGMGGLSGGEKVSQKIVMDALAMGHQLKPGMQNGFLWKMVDKINENVNRMLGPDGLYKSGSTLVAVLAYNRQFQWIAVGDSRIYLYRQGYASQLNHDHDQLQVWMSDVLSGRLTMEEVLRNPDSRKLTSFIGMGQLRFVDGSRGAIALEPGDRLVLMSDGIYNLIGEDRLADVLKRYPDVEQAAAVIDRLIRDGNLPHQDNYTAIVLGF